MDEDNKNKIETEQEIREDIEHLDDVVFDEEIELTTEDGESLPAKDKVKKLQEKIKALEKEKTEYLDGWQRARADYANLTKSTEEDRKRIRGFVEEGFIHELLPVVDSFQMAFSNKESWEKVEGTWRTGVEYIYSQLMSMLEGHKLSLFGEIGEGFDASKHEAMSEDETQEKEKDHTVSKIIQKGFMLDGTVIRPARVQIYKLKE